MCRPQAPDGSVIRGTCFLAVTAPGEAAAHVAACTLQPVSRSGATTTPPPLVMAHEVPGGVVVPRMYALDRFAAPGGGGDGWRDERSLGGPLSSCATAVVLSAASPPQVPAMEAVMAVLRGPRGAAQLKLPCGFGKTVCGIWAIAALGRKALVLVPDRGLKQQWMDRLATHAPALRVGVVQGKRADWAEADVCIGMVQSLFRPNKYPAAMYDAFGTIVVDEHHLMAAREFSKVVPLFSARHLLALSATPERDDGCTPALHWLFGPVAFECARARERVDVTCIQYTGGDRSELYFPWNKEQLNYNAMLERLVLDRARNAMIVRETLARRAGRAVIVLTARREHIVELARLFAAADPALRVGLYHGDLDDGQRQAALRTKYDVFISIMQLGKQALDKPELGALVLATPIANKYEQAVGRVLRPYPDKPVPLVLDVVDPYSVFFGMARKRARLYAAEGYVVQTVAVAR